MHKTKNCNAGTFSAARQSRQTSHGRLRERNTRRWRRRCRGPDRLGSSPPPQSRSAGSCRFGCFHRQPSDRRLARSHRLPLTKPFTWPLIFQQKKTTRTVQPVRCLRLPSAGDDRVPRVSLSFATFDTWSTAALPSTCFLLTGQSANLAADKINQSIGFIKIVRDCEKPPKRHALIGRLSRHSRRTNQSLITFQHFGQVDTGATDSAGSAVKHFISR